MWLVFKCSITHNEMDLALFVYCLYSSISQSAVVSRLINLNGVSFTHWSNCCLALIGWVTLHLWTVCRGVDSSHKFYEFRQNQKKTSNSAWTWTLWLENTWYLLPKYIIYKVCHKSILNYVPLFPESTNVKATEPSLISAVCQTWVDFLFDE